MKYIHRFLDKPRSVDNIILWLIFCILGISIISFALGFLRGYYGI